MKLWSSSDKKGWAFDAVLAGLSARLEGVKMAESRSDADVFLQMAPSTYFGNYSELQRTVCRLSGHRWANRENLEYARIAKNLSECHTLIATSPSLEKIGLEINPSTKLIPNGIDLAKWAYREPSDSKLVCVGFCGNISKPEYLRHKGFDVAREAASALTGVTFRTALYGDCQIPQARMLEDFYRQIDILVLPTDGEGCSNTITEAIAAGVPVVTTRKTGYHAEKMKNLKNILFCDKNPESVKHCIGLLIEDIELRKSISLAARSFAETNQDIISIAKKYAEVLNSCHRDNGGEIPRPKNTDKEIIQKLDAIMLTLQEMKNKKTRRGK